MSAAARELCRLFAVEVERRGLGEQATRLVDALDVAADGSPDSRSDDGPSAVAEKYYRSALGLALASEAGDLASALVPIGSRLVWTQTDTYVQSPPHEHFLERYAHATILGSRASSALLVDGSCTAAVGVLLIGPDNQYPHHQHHADEAYLPLTPAAWSSALDAPYRDLAPGSILHHASLQPHSVHTGDTSLLALYLWTGDTTTSAWLC